MLMLKKIYSKRKLTIFVLLAVVTVGFYTKFYSGPFSAWVNDSLGGLFYIIFWSLLLYLLFPKVKPIRIVAIVFIITCALEVLQLWHPYFLEIIRSNFLGQTILGSSFSWFDFPYYLVGAGISVFIINHLNKFETC
jgi:hypothetical protein